MVGLLRWWKNFEDMYNRLDSIPACDRQTDGQRDRRTDILPQHSPRYAYASHVIKWNLCRAYFIDWRLALCSSLSSSLSPVRTGDKVWIKHGRLCWKSTVAETGDKSATKSTVAVYGRLCCRFWQQIGNNLNSTACRGRHCRQLRRVSPEHFSGQLNRTVKIILHNHWQRHTFSVIV